MTDATGWGNCVLSTDCQLTGLTSGQPKGWFASGVMAVCALDKRGVATGKIL